MLGWLVVAAVMVAVLYAAGRVSIAMDDDQPADPMTDPDEDDGG